MKKKMFKFSCLALMGFSLAACSEEETLVNDISTPVAKKGITFVAQDFVSEDGTRADFTFNEEENSVAVAFSSTDVIGVWGMRDGMMEPVSFLVSEAATEGQSATFDGGLWRLREDDTKYAAVYPYFGGCYNDENGSYIDLDYNYNYYSNPSSLSNQDYMVCDAVSATDGSVEFSMKHLGAIVRVHLTGLAANAYVNNLKISLDSPDFLMYGKVYIGETFSDIKPNIIEWDPEYTPWNNEKNIVCDINTDANGEAYIYFMTAPVDLSNKTISFEATVNGISYSGSNIYTDKNITAGSYKKLSAVMAMDMTGKQQLSEGENTIDPEATGYIFAPSATGLYTLENATVIGANDYWGDNGQQWILIAGNNYSIETTESSLTITKTDELTELPLNEQVTVTTGTKYIINITTEGIYEISSNNGENTLIYSYGGTESLPTQTLFYNRLDIVSFQNDDEIKISKIEIASISIGSNAVENGCWYSFTVTESGWYTLSSENGWINNGSDFTDYSPDNTYYVQFIASSGTSGTITLNKVDLSKAISIPVGEEVTTEKGQIYSVDLNEGTNYILSSESTDWIDISVHSENGSFNMYLNNNYSSECYETTTYYFTPNNTATFTIVTAE